VPAALVSQEIQQQKARMFQSFGGNTGNSVDLDKILPDQMFEEGAERRVKLGLILSQYIQEFSIQADGQIVRKTIEDLAATYEKPEEVVKWYYSNEDQLAAVESQVVEDLLVERLLETASINEQPCTYAEVLSLAQQDR